MGDIPKGFIRTIHKNSCPYCDSKKLDVRISKEGSCRDDESKWPVMAIGVICRKCGRGVAVGKKIPNDILDVYVGM
jgi:hypothetical protein